MNSLFSADQGFLSTLDGPRGSKYDLFILFLLVLKLIGIFMSLKLTSVLSYVKEKIKIYLEVMLMIEILSMYLHPRAPMACI